MKPWSSMGLTGLVVRLRLALWGRALRAVQARGHALLDILAERLHRCGVVEVREPDLQTDDVCGPRTRELVDKAHTRDHVRRLNGRPNHAQDQVVPILINLAAPDVWLQLELEVAARRVHLVLPLWTDVVPEYHDGIDDVEAVRLLADHALLLQQLAGLGHVVPELPEGLHRGEGRHLVRGVGVGGSLLVGLHDLLPDGPGVAQGQVLLQHLVVLLGVVRGKLQVRVEVLVEAEVGHRAE
mmetsp:Transcript_79189/g.256369  ORF Transcript_79189/g.256369 Transcript_79189/m.256369 type:complete len:240 (+) Transcript_79189:181-900(+)